MRVKTLLAALCAAMVLSGCDDLTTPQGVVGTAYTATQKSDLKLLKKALQADALVRYGTPEGLVELKAKFEGHEILAGPTSLVSTEKDPRGWDRERRYTVEVLSKKLEKGSHPEHFGTAHIRCRVEYVYRERPSWENYPERGGYYPGPCYYGQPGPYCHYDEDTRCWITQLQ